MVEVAHELGDLESLTDLGGPSLPGVGIDSLKTKVCFRVWQMAGSGSYPSICCVFHILFAQYPIPDQPEV